jgi:hypothetical protein
MTSMAGRIRIYLVIVPNIRPKFAATDAPMITGRKFFMTDSDMYLKKNTTIGMRIATVTVSWKSKGLKNRTFVLSFINATYPIYFCKCMEISM